MHRTKASPVRGTLKQRVGSQDTADTPESQESAGRKPWGPAGVRWDTEKVPTPLPLFFGLLNGDNGTVFAYLRETLPALFKGSSHESCCVITKSSYDKET